MNTVEIKIKADTVVIAKGKKFIIGGNFLFTYYGVYNMWRCRNMWFTREEKNEIFNTIKDYIKRRENRLIKKGGDNTEKVEIKMRDNIAVIARGKIFVVCNINEISFEEKEDMWKFKCMLFTTEEKVEILNTIRDYTNQKGVDKYE